MNNIALGQYVDGNSIIHRLDPRTKLLSLMLMMVATFFIPSPLDSKYGVLSSFIALGILALLIIIIVLLIILTLNL